MAVRCRNEGPADRAELIGHIEGSSIPSPAFIACGGLVSPPALRAAAVQPDLDAPRRGREARDDNALGRQDEEIVVQDWGHSQSRTPDMARVKVILPRMTEPLQQYNATARISKFQAAPLSL